MYEWSSYYWKVRTSSKFTLFCLSPTVKGMVSQLSSTCRTTFVLCPLRSLSWWLAAQHTLSSPLQGYEHRTAFLKTAVLDNLKKTYPRSVEIQSEGQKTLWKSPYYGTLTEFKFSNATEGLRSLYFSKLMAFQEELASGAAFERNTFLNHLAPFYNHVCTIRYGQVKQLKYQNNLRSKDIIEGSPNKTQTREGSPPSPK